MVLVYYMLKLVYIYIILYHFKPYTVYLWHSISGSVEHYRYYHDPINFMCFQLDILMTTKHVWTALLLWGFLHETRLTCLYRGIKKTFLTVPAFMGRDLCLANGICIGDRVVSISGQPGINRMGWRLQYF